MIQSRRPPVILQVIPALGAGGAEQGCIDVAGAIVKSGGRALIASNGGARVPELMRIGAEHIDMPVHSKNPIIMARNTRRLVKIIQRERVDIVHARSRAPAWSAYKACQKTNAQFMTTCHAPYNFDNELKRKYNAVMTKGARVIAISRYVADYMVDHYGVDERSIRLIHRGIKMDRFHPSMVTPRRMIAVAEQWRIPDGANVVMLPGRITRWKGHHVLIDALARLNRSDIFCVIIGADQGRSEYAAELKQSIEDKNLSGQVRIIDHCDDMPAAYMLAGVVVSASTDPEGFGRIPVEAQAMGRPIIATDHGGAQETVLAGQTGWLVPPSDAPALAKALEDALAMNVNQRELLAAHAMAHVQQHFTVGVMCEKTLDVYTELLHTPQALHYKTAVS